jgi:hypothetical protein
MSTIVDVVGLVMVSMVGLDVEVGRNCVRFGCGLMMKVGIVGDCFAMTCASCILLYPLVGWCRCSEKRFVDIVDVDVGECCCGCCC